MAVIKIPKDSKFDFEIWEVKVLFLIYPIFFHIIWPLNDKPIKISFFVFFLQNPNNIPSGFTFFPDVRK